MKHAHVEARFFTGPVGKLDARSHGPADGQPVLILHPHPQFGGTMGSRLVYDVAVALAAAGLRAVRFDYRGVGRSEGFYGHGEGEVDDAAAVFDALRDETGVVPCVVGYSFGGAVACRLAATRPVERLVVVATPLALTLSKLQPEQDAPKVQAVTTVVAGAADHLVPSDEPPRLAAAFRPPARLVVIPGAGHFMEPSHNPRAVRAIVDALRA